MVVGFYGYASRFTLALGIEVDAGLTCITDSQETADLIPFALSLSKRSLILQKNLLKAIRYDQSRPYIGDLMAVAGTH